jgi:hypothetical protein
MRRSLSRPNAHTKKLHSCAKALDNDHANKSRAGKIFSVEQLVPKSQAREMRGEVPDQIHPSEARTCGGGANKEQFKSETQSLIDKKQSELHSILMNVLKLQTSKRDKSSLGDQGMK